MQADNQLINSLWIGKKLSAIELLTLHSFLRHGHTFHLWVYEELDNDLPDGVVLRNANEIIPHEAVFAYPKRSRLDQLRIRLADRGLHFMRPKGIDWGDGSYAGFSDIFRYKLLFEKGGWWVDMDVTCLQAFDFSSPYFFRNHWKLDVVGNIMKCPQHSALMKSCYERAAKEVTRDNEDWHKPILILNEEIKQHRLSKYIREGLFNLDIASTIEQFRRKDLPIPEQWIGIHWINSTGTTLQVGNNTLNRLLAAYGLSHAPIQ
ncbi:MAG: glycosyltransferase [Bacteroidota bacterium]